MKKKLLVLPKFFFPDSGASCLLYTELCEDLVPYFDITVICTVPSYAGPIAENYKKNRYYYEDYKGIHIMRVRVGDVNKTSKFSRITGILRYYIDFKKAIKKAKKQDVILAGSQPPILGGRLGVYAKKRLGGKLVYYVHDFNPEQAEFTGYVHNRLLLHLVRWIDNCSCKKSDLVIISSPDMQKNLVNRFKEGKVPNNLVIENWVDVRKVQPVPREENPEFDRLNLPRNGFYISYAGNLGIMQNFPTVLEAAAILQKTCPDIQIVLIGDGALKPDLEETIRKKKLTNVFLFPMQPAGQESFLYSLGDVELISIGLNVTKCSIPSKTCKICAAGRPILCQADVESDLAGRIRSHRMGVVVPPKDAAAFAAAAEELYEDRANLPQMGINSRAFAENHLTRKVAVEKFKRALTESFF